MPLSKCIKTEWNAGEAMRLRDVLKSHLRDLYITFMKEPDDIHSLSYNVHVENINHIKRMIQRIEKPLFDEGYLDTMSNAELVLFRPLHGRFSYRGQS